MQTLMRTGAQTISSSWSAKVSSVSPCSEVSTVQCVSGSCLKTRGRSTLRLRADRSRTSSCGRLQRLTVRADQSSIDEKVKEIASDEAVEGAGIADRESKLKVDDLKPVDHPGTAGEGTAAGLLLKVEEEEDESAETAVERDASLDVTSASAVEDSQTFFKDVEEDAQEVGASLGRSVEDAAVGLESKAEDLEERQVKEAELLNKAEFEEGTSAPVTKSGGELTRAQAQEKFVETAKDGYEVLKWAAEGVVSAGQNARQGLGVAKEAVDKRLKSFGIAADDTRDVSSQVAEVAQKKMGELHGSASKFGEEVQVNLEEKKAADSLKPESETNPLAKLGQELQGNLEKATAEDSTLGKLGKEFQGNLEKATAEDSTLGKLGRELQGNITKATSEDGPLAKLSETLSESLSKVSKAGQDFTARGSEKKDELTSKAAESGEEITDKAQENAEELTSKIGGSGEDLSSSFAEERSTSSQPQSGDAIGDLKTDYEDERGNELLKGRSSDNDVKSNLKFDVDEAQVIPSKKQDKSDIGPDE